MSGPVLPEHVLLAKIAELRTITDHAPEIIGRVDRDLRHLFINRAITSVTGKSVEWYLGKTNEELGHRQDLCELWNANFRKVFETGQPTEEEFNYGVPGSPMWFHIRAVPEFGGDGSVESVIFVATDITARKSLEQELQSAAHFPGENPNPVIRIDSDGIVLYTNRACAKWLVDNPCEVGKPAPEPFAKSAAAALASGEVCEVEVETKGRAFLFLCTPIPGTEHVNLYPTDITQRKRAEAELWESRERLTLALASSGAAVFDWDILKNKRIWDDNVHRMLGTDPATFNGTAEEFFRVIHPEDWSTMEGALAGAIATGTLEVEYRAILPDGNIRHVASRGKVHRDSDGRAVRMTGVTWDVTARKRSEEEIRMLNQDLESRVIERTSELLTAVNALETEIAERQRLEREILEIGEHEKSRVGQDLHDGLCQELAGIAFLAKALKRNLEENKLSVEAAAAKADNIANLLKEAITGARGLATGMYPVSIEESGLAAALEKLAEDTAQRFHVECLFECAEPVELADNQAAAHVYRITQEAVSNAIRHGRAECVVIKLATEGDELTLEIEDDGEGLLKELKPTGMGLRTMAYRARSIGGSLELRQRPKGGIAVIFTFPNQGR